MGVACHVVVVPTKPTGCFVTFVVAKTHGHRHLPFKSLIHLSPVFPSFAVAGTFFDKATWQPVGDIIIDRQQVHFGGIGHAFAVYPDKHTALLGVERNRHMGLDSLRNALRSGPRLVQNGSIRYDYAEQGFRDPHVISGSAVRCGVGIRKYGYETVFIVTAQPITLKTFARMFLREHCTDALNLDGGGSLSLFHDGRTIIRPSRDLTNIVVAF
jgi:hypothetical protein